jgi:hypothetical protein
VSASSRIGCAVGVSRSQTPVGAALALPAPGSIKAGGAGCGAPSISPAVHCPPGAGGQLVVDLPRSPHGSAAPQRTT